MVRFSFLPFLAIFFFITSCRGKVYVLNGEVTSSAINCGDYPNILNQTQWEMQLQQLFQKSSQTFDLVQLKDQANQISTLIEKIKTTLTPELTDNQQNLQYTWKIENQYLFNNSQLTPLEINLDGVSISTEELKISDIPGFKQITLNRKGSILEFCSLSRFAGGLLKITSPGSSEFYYRLMLFPTTNSSNVL